MATIIDGSLAPRGGKKSFPNGMEWYKINITDSDIIDVDILYVYEANGTWVAGSKYDTGLFYSLNGKDWAQSNIFSGGFYHIYNANGIWVACSYRNNGLYYSTDGKIWKQSNITSGTFYSVYNANGIWVTGGMSGNLGLYYSTNGQTWTKGNITSYAFNFVTNANGIWIACSNSNTGLYYSVDGKSWSRSNIQTGNFLVAHYFNRVWIATSYNSTGQGIYYSTDGKTWSQSNLGTGHSGYPICDANGICVIGSYSREGLWYSSDGKNWQATNITSGNFCFVYYAQGVWIAGEYAGKLYHSFDGKVWEKYSEFYSAAFWGAYNANGIWVLGTSSSLYYSPTWEVSTTPRTMSEEWVLKSSVTTSSLNFSSDSFAKIPLDCEFSSGLADYDKFVLVHDSQTSSSLGDQFTV